MIPPLQRDTRNQHSCTMFKKVVQQGRNERGAEGVPLRYVEGSE